MNWLNFAAVSVSYTHLDVYKRQVSDIIAHLNGKGIQAVRQTVYACLLYTSDVYKRQYIDSFDVAGYTNKIVDMVAADLTVSVELLCENKLMKTIIDHYGRCV